MRRPVQVTTIEGTRSSAEDHASEAPGRQANLVASVPPGRLITGVTPAFSVFNLATFRIQNRAILIANLMRGCRNIL